MKFDNEPETEYVYEELQQKFLDFKLSKLGSSGLSEREKKAFDEMNKEVNLMKKEEENRNINVVKD